MGVVDRFALDDGREDGSFHADEIGVQRLTRFSLENTNSTHVVTVNRFAGKPVSAQVTVGGHVRVELLNVTIVPSGWVGIQGGLNACGGLTG
jgi:hypothetical protein